MFVVYSFSNSIMKRRNRIATIYTRASFLVTGVLVGLKLTGIINVSWLWALSPVWFNIVAALILVLVAKRYLDNGNYR